MTVRYATEALPFNITKLECNLSRLLNTYQHVATSAFMNASASAAS